MQAICARHEAGGPAVEMPRTFEYEASRLSDGVRMNAGYFYIVRYWIAPAAEARVLEYLDGHHTADVVAQPGFLSARRVRLEEVDALGWRAFTTIYELESKSALDAYFKSAARAKFGREQQAFADVMRVERSAGAGEWGASK